MQPITYDAKHGLTRESSEIEVHQLRSDTQSFALIERQTRPNFPYRFSKMQSTFRKCLRSRLAQVKSHCRTRYIYIHTWHLFSPAFSWDDPVVAKISDAGVCQEQDQFDGITQNFISQQACVTALAPSNALNPGRMVVHLYELKFDENQKNCRSTLMTEANVLSNAVEQGL